MAETEEQFADLRKSPDALQTFNDALTKQCNDLSVRLKRDAEEAFGRERKEAKEALAHAQGDGEKAKKALLEEQGKVKKLKEKVGKLQEQYNEIAQKNRDQKEEKEKLEKLISTTKKELEEAMLEITGQEKTIEESEELLEKLQKQKSDLEEMSKLDKESLEKIQKEKEKLEEDLTKSSSTNSQLRDKLRQADATNLWFQCQLDAMQATNSRNENKVMEQVAKCSEYQTTLQETTANLNTRETQLTELLGRVVQLERKLVEKTCEIDIVRRDLNIERQEKSLVKKEFTKFQEFVRNCSVEAADNIAASHRNVARSPEREVSSNTTPANPMGDFQSPNVEVATPQIISTEKDNDGVAINENDEASSSSVITTCSYKSKICSPQEQETSTETNLFSNIDFPPLEETHEMIATSFGDNEDDNAEVNLIGCRKCPRTFPTWAEFYRHQKTIHTVQMSKKFLQRREASVKPLFSAFVKKQKKKGISKIKIKQKANGKKAIPIIKIKQRKTRNSEHWNIVAPSPAPSVITNDEYHETENLSMDCLSDKRMQSPSASSSAPLDQNSHDDHENENPSSLCVQNESPHHRPPLTEVNNITGVGATTIIQPQNHGIDKTKSAHGSYNQVKKSSMISCEFCAHKFWTMEQLQRHQQAYHSSNSQPQPPHANENHSHSYSQQSLEVSQGDESFQDCCDGSGDNNNHSSAAPTTSTHHPQAAEIEHGLDISKQDEGVFCMCGQKFSWKKNLAIHVGYFTLDWKFKCDMCSTYFYYLTYLKRHYADAHNKPNILSEFAAGCKECGNMFKTKDEYWEHWRRKHSKKNKEGKLKNTKPRRYNKGRQHSSSHGARKVHYQDLLKEEFGLGLFCVCGDESVKKDALIKHISQYRGDKKFNCNICYRWFKYLSSLQTHQKAEHNAKKCIHPLYGCQHCGREFLLRRLLRNHIERFHPDAKRNRKLISKSTSEHLVPRPPTVSSPSRHVHELDISLVKREKGVELDASVDQNSAVMEHRVDHSKARLGFYCKCGINVSGTGKVGKYYLRRHINYANAKSRFKCPQCELRFKYTGYLKFHVWAHHNSDYTLTGCTTCGNVFENTKALWKHKKSQRHCRRKLKRIEEIDLTNLPTPAPHRAGEYLEEIQQQDVEFITPVALIPGS